MTVLRKITLSNIRRFAADVTVPVSPQATIFLAPNGTGKTALFEAIELALTGAVARLEEDMFALVRDGERRAEVSLDFGEFEQRAVVTTDAAPVHWSGPSQLHGKSNPADIGYLLRLTHLLDQRDKHWFTQENSLSAGEQLTRLPIGKDAQHASSLITGLKQAVTRVRAENERSANAAMDSVQAWNDLLHRRNEARARISQELPTLTELAEALQRHSAEQISAENLESLEADQVVCASDAQTKLGGLRGQFAALQQMEAICNAFAAAVADVARLVALKVQRQQAREEAQQKRDAAAAKVTEAAAAHIEADLGLQRIRDELFKVEEKDRLQRSFQAENEALAGERQAHAQCVVARTSASAALKLAEDAEDAHAQWITARADWQDKVGELEEATRAWSDWSVDIERIRSCDERILGINQAIVDHQRVLGEKEVAYGQALHRAAEARERLQTLQQSSDSVRAAVAAIAADLPEERGDCPVCGVEHGAIELRRRMVDQLQAIDPALRSLAEHERECREAVVQSERLKDEAAQLHRQSLAQHDAASGDRVVLQGRVDAVRRLQLFDGADLETANARLASWRKELNEAKVELDERLQQLGPRPTAEALVQCRQLDHSAAGNESEAAQALRHREGIVAMIQQQLDASLLATAPLRSLEPLMAEATTQGALVDRRLQERRQAEALADIDEAGLRQSKVLFDGAHSEWQSAVDRMRECRERWSSQQLPGEPDQAVLARSLADLESAISRAEGASVELDQIRQNIARLRGAVDYRTTQDVIDAQRGERSELEHGSYLMQLLDAAADDLKHVDESKSTLDTFSLALTREVEQIHTRLLDIEPLWQSLLGRIVREPRFSQTGLQYLRRYNKLHAHVQVPVGGRDAPAYKVASEAQKADLQLSFLLSMAQVHRWSPWKALLLDDPTQHHDLVHASAVFDVLRDYIVEHGFQTLVTTHDAVQARFFARKLENDGVKVQLLTLAPLEGGVNVQPLGRRA
ncbi:AAA family ATPase [Burkholderia cenocepacia]|uniref:AAA family ATPase n=1 Tax=Burkholderia cenocepacia TaxID=95486 RepID=UPI001CF44D2E|nr:AAA family ATPase [Burkholderia cenocepacia]MCA8404703.1 AAA family ATPase [Burkholderia cenocepacia]